MTRAELVAELERARACRGGSAVGSSRWRQISRGSSTSYGLGQHTDEGLCSDALISEVLREQVVRRVGAPNGEGAASISSEVVM